MSALDTTTVAGAATAKRTRKKHIYYKVDGQFAREMGTQVRAYCGFWVWPSTLPGRSIGPKDAGPNNCKTCIRGLARHQRELASS